MAVIVSRSEDGDVIRFRDTRATSVNRMKRLDSSDWTHGCVSAALSNKSVSDGQGSCTGFSGIFDDFTKVSP